MVPALIVTHGPLGEALVRAAASIVGPVEGVDTLSNEGLSREAMDERVRARLAAWGAGGGLVFVDLLGGSCAQAAMLGAQASAPGPVPVVCGINLPMLLDYLQNRA